MRQKAILLLALGCLMGYEGWAQEKTISLTGGYTLPLSEPHEYIIGPTMGADVTMAWPTLHAEGHRAPYLMGLKANFAYIPRGIAGHRIGLSGYVTTPIVVLNRWIAPADLSLQIGAGLGLYTNPKERSNDPHNDFVGSYLNSVLDFGLVYTQPIGHAGSVVLGAKFVHNSNGYLVKPNQGLNYLQGELGWKLAPNQRSERSYDTLVFDHRYDARTGGFLLLAPGITVPRHKLAQNGELYPAYTVQLGWRYAYQRCRSMAATVDFAYNFADNYKYYLEGTEPPLPLFIGLTAMHETHWGPISLRLGLGYYVYESFPDSRLYERVGVYYHYGRKWRQVVGLAIKANSTHADFIEWSWGIDLF